MAFYDKFPYTNFQELNLDWLTQEVSKVRDNRNASDASAAAALSSERAAKASETAAKASETAAKASETAAAGSAAASADYLEQIGTHTAGAAADWLKENLQPTTPPVDSTLSIAGAAADAKKTGDDITDLKNAIDYSLAKYYSFTINNNKYVDNGALVNGTVSNSLRASTDVIDTFADEILVIPKYGYTINVGARNGDDWEELGQAFTVPTVVNLSGYNAFFIRAANSTAITHTDNATVCIKALDKLFDLQEIVHTPENLFLKYGHDSVHFSISNASILTAGTAHYMAVLPCAPNTKYIVSIKQNVTTHPRFQLAWSEKYPEARLEVYDWTVKNDDARMSEYTTGNTARFLLVYFGFTMATETPENYISITGYDLHIDPYARNYIEISHDVRKQSANVLRLKKTGDETYGECDAKFMFMTDIHADVSRLKDATRRYKEWSNSYISAVLNGGDTVYQKLPDGLDWYYDQINTLDIPVLPTVGNHDAWSALSVLETDPVVVYNAIIAPIVSSTGIVQPANAAANGYNYYYKDFNNTVRLVVLDCMYWDTTQLSWLESVLADAKTNGLHVIALTHCAFPWANMQTVDCSWSKAGMLNGYSSRGVLSDPSRTNIQAAQAVKDFIDAGGTFICWLTGHQHGDDVHILPNYGNQFVVTLGSFAQRASMLQKSDIVTDYNYNCLTYITIDTFLKVIKFMRVGADIDMYGVKHNFLSIKYDEPRLISAN